MLIVCIPSVNLFMKETFVLPRCLQGVQRFIYCRFTKYFPPRNTLICPLDPWCPFSCLSADSKQQRHCWAYRGDCPSSGTNCLALRNKIPGSFNHTLWGFGVQRPCPTTGGTAHQSAKVAQCHHPLNHRRALPFCVEVNVWVFILRASLMLMSEMETHL